MPGTLSSAFVLLPLCLCCVPHLQGDALPLRGTQRLHRAWCSGSPQPPRLLVQPRRCGWQRGSPLLTLLPALHPALPPCDPQVHCASWQAAAAASRGRRATRGAGAALRRRTPCCYCGAGRRAAAAATCWASRRPVRRPTPPPLGACARQTRPCLACPPSALPLPRPQSDTELDPRQARLRGDAAEVSWLMRTKYIAAEAGLKRGVGARKPAPAAGAPRSGDWGLPHRATAALRPCAEQAGGAAGAAGCGAAACQWRPPLCLMPPVSHGPSCSRRGGGAGGPAGSAGAPDRGAVCGGQGAAGALQGPLAHAGRGAAGCAGRGTGQRRHLWMAPQGLVALAPVPSWLYWVPLSVLLFLNPRTLR